jgi:hypothetical protein
MQVFSARRRFQEHNRLPGLFSQQKGSCCLLTRHELKEQLQHDQFTDAVSSAVGYASSHRQSLVRWSVIGAVVLVIAAGAWWYLRSQRDARREDLATALAVLDAQIGPPNEYAKTFATESAKQDAGVKALSDVVGKDGGSKEGLIAQYYRGTLRAQTSGKAGAESDLKTVADSSSEVAPLAKIALAQIYMGEKKTTEAQGLLKGLVDDPKDLVSKAQAQVLLAQMQKTLNPQQSKDALKSIDNTDQLRPAVKKATEQLNSELTK